MTDLTTAIQLINTIGVTGILLMLVYWFIRGDVVSRKTVDLLLPEIAARTILAVETLLKTWRVEEQEKVILEVRSGDSKTQSMVAELTKSLNLHDKQAGIILKDVESILRGTYIPDEESGKSSHSKD